MSLDHNTADAVRAKLARMFAELDIAPMSDNHVDAFIECLDRPLGAARIKELESARVLRHSSNTYSQPVYAVRQHGPTGEVEWHCTDGYVYYGDTELGLDATSALLKDYPHVKVFIP